MDTLAQSLIEGMDDSSFCETLIPIMLNQNGSGASLLFEDWVLARLRVISQRDRPLFYHTFLTQLRITFPGKIFPADVLAAMSTVTTQTQVEEGDVSPAVWHGEIEDVFRNGLRHGVHPGWDNLRPHYRPLKGDVTIMTGMPSHYKSAFMHALALNLAKAHGWNFSVFNPEHHPLGSLGGWLVESYMGRRMHQLDEDERAYAKGWVTDRFHMIRPRSEQPATIDWLLGVARIQKERYGLDGVILDPWNLIHHAFSRREKLETEYIGESLAIIKRFAEYQDVHVWVVAHPTKPKEERAKKGDYAGKFPPVTPYAISGSAHWFNMADCCLCCWRDVEHEDPSVQSILEVHVQKNRRYDQCGYPGKARLRYDGRRFYAVGDMTTPAPVTEHWAERYA
jgi:hypothetical protein